MIERIGLEIYVFIIHINIKYHYILLEDKEIKFILPFEDEIENLLING